jgi:hypothetical protein
MNAWLLLLASFVFALLAYDAWKIGITAAAKDSYALTAKGFGVAHGGLPLHEQQRRKEWGARYGIGNVSQSVWLWGILTLGCLIGSVIGFLS